MSSSHLLHLRFAVGITARLTNVRLAYFDRMGCCTSHGQYICWNNHSRPNHSQSSRLRPSYLARHATLLGCYSSRGFHQYCGQRIITSDWRPDPDISCTGFCCSLGATCISLPTWLSSECLPNIIELRWMAYARAVLLRWIYWQCCNIRRWVTEVKSCTNITSWLAFIHQGQMLLFMSVLPSFDTLPAHFFQMSEEIDNAALNVPRAIFTTMVLNGVTGFGMVLAVLFCLGDIETVLVRNPISNVASIWLMYRKHQPAFPSYRFFMTAQGRRQEPQ